MTKTTKKVIDTKVVSVVEAKKEQATKAVVTAENIKTMDLGSKVAIYGDCLEKEVPSKVARDNAYTAFNNLMSIHNFNPYETNIDSLRVFTLKKASKEDLEKRDFAKRVGNTINLYRSSSRSLDKDEINLFNKAFGKDFVATVDRLYKEAEIEVEVKVEDVVATKELKEKARKLFKAYQEADNAYTTILQQKNVIESYVDMCKKISTIK